ncbi:cytochrome P450 family protein [Catenuloplanes indicus]|uniref:Cytochrome P450 n=1 Tax=Catenuloplanes indicus TaxID=137267 RepID=A0AAE3W7B0_9ACTN|nr:cytochrome P450 [Catenuloplanes indicus]MDQ0369974.1 cytochrome P450 [Catenuloplanes indicus]
MLVVTPEFKADSPHRYAQLREHGPVHRARLTSGVEAWIVVGYDAARTALTHPDLLKDPAPAEDALARIGFTAHRAGVGLGGNMLESDPPTHTRLRRLVAGAFSPRRTQDLAPRVRQIADELLDAMREHDEVDLVAAYTEPLPITVICELLGVPEGAERGQFRGWSSLALSPPSEQQRAATASLIGYLAELVARKRARPGDDLLSALAQEENAEDGRLTREELIGTAALLVIAGHDTTVNLIGNAVVALLRQPGQAELLRARPELIQNAVEEFLRYDPSVEQSSFRYAHADLDLDGVRITKGDVVVVALGSASRDAPQQQGGAPADRLDVARAVPRHLAFGHGIHHCLGAPLARLEAATAIGKLLRRFPHLRATGPVAEIPWIPGGMMRGPRSLPVRLTAG